MHTATPLAEGIPRDCSGSWQGFPVRRGRYARRALGPQRTPHVTLAPGQSSASAPAPDNLFESARAQGESCSVRVWFGQPFKMVGVSTTHPNPTPASLPQDGWSKVAGTNLNGPGWVWTNKPNTSEPPTVRMQVTRTTVSNRQSVSYILYTAENRRVPSSSIFHLQGSRREYSPDKAQQEGHDTITKDLTRSIF
jgi:hypothetical protein